MKQHDIIYCNNHEPVSLDTVLNSGEWLTIKATSTLIGKHHNWIRKTIKNGQVLAVCLPVWHGIWYVNKASALAKWG